MGEQFQGTLPAVRTSEDRLDSWKDIATYLNRDVTTVQRWEKREGMPVHRHLHDSKGSVYASRAELDAWQNGRNLRAAQENWHERIADDISPQPSPTQSDATRAPDPQAGVLPGNSSETRKVRWVLLAACLIFTAVIGLWIRHRLLY